LIERLCTKARGLGRRIASDLGVPATYEALRRYAYKEGQKAVIEAQQRAGTITARSR
jgi:hypothetical protein